LAVWPSPAGGEEYALAFDAGRAHRILVLPAWFDEGNKLRHFTVEVMRRLDGAGIDCLLPDLPGCNESLASLAEQDLASWRAAAAEAAWHFSATRVLAIRAGAMIAPDAVPGWRYAPLAGSAQLRALLRARVLASREAGREENRERLLAEGRKAGLELAGYRLGAQLIGDLAEAELPAAGQQRDIAQNDVGGPGLWLRAEPDYDPGQADALAAIVSMELLATERPLPLRAEVGVGNVGHKPYPPPPSSEGEVERRHFACDCAGSALAATLDEAPGATGLLIVTGGNETRAGAFSSQARLAALVAAAGHPVIRFDRRGVGDSEGVNMGFRHSAEDIAAALATFRERCPQLKRVVGFGNCDAASALMLAGGAGFAGLVLSNPWTYEDAEADAPPPPSAVRARYAAKLKNPRELLRLVGGKVNLRDLLRSLRHAASSGPGPSGLAKEMDAGLKRFSGPVRFLIAERDRTGQAFLANWNSRDPRLCRCAGADHAYSDDASCEWLVGQVLSVLKDE
jgi:exosortase A-associated hydrolase 1